MDRKGWLITLIWIILFFLIATVAIFYFSYNHSPATENAIIQNNSSEENSNASYIEEINKTSTDFNLTLSYLNISQVQNSSQ
jgi:flagellar basal body-associated protein FliL